MLRVSRLEKFLSEKSRVLHASLNCLLIYTQRGAYSSSAAGVLVMVALSATDISP